MAGNKNPWRDILSPAEWAHIQANAALAAARVNPVLGGARAAARPGGGGWTVGSTGGLVNTPAMALQQITNQITAYDGIAKDDYTKFDERIQKLKFINILCGKYIQLLGPTHVLAMKAAAKQLNNQLDLWVRSLGKRAIKKADYLATMKEWHKTAKAKYKNRVQLSMFLRGLAGDNTRNAGEKLHATPYATIEKIDPYHRQTFVFFDPADATQDNSVNMMGDAFLDYVVGQPASNPVRATNPNASFYEWLEYHPFCVGTPVVTAGADQFKDPNTISYEGQDLAYVYQLNAKLEYERILTGGGVRVLLKTADFRPSGKGPPGAVAFVWDADCCLWAHEHGVDGFIHASAKQGKKIRCSGMLVADKGLAQIITNQSGHYAPNAQSIYYFVTWLRQRNCLHANAKVEMEHDQAITDGTYKAADFLNWARPKYPAPAGLQYWV